jgi:hypothetical protein
MEPKSVQELEAEVERLRDALTLAVTIIDAVRREYPDWPYVVIGGNTLKQALKKDV